MNIGTATGNHQPRHANVSLGYWTTLFGVGICILTISLFTRASGFADFDTYVLYLDQLVHFPPSGILVFEGLSNVYLLSIHWIFRSVETTIVFAHYLLGLIFLIGILRTFPPGKTSWQSLLFAFSIVGPLLAFVTLRATPAYFLIAISARHARTRDFRALACFILAVSFHISSTLAAIPLLLLFFRDNLPDSLKMDHPIILTGGVLAIILVGLIVPELSNTLTNLIKSIPFLSKFAAYTDQEIVSVSVNSLNHYIFLAFTFIFTAMFFWFSDQEGKIWSGYVLASFAIYLALFFQASPVAAFRQAPFWLLPMIAVFPWHRIGVYKAMAPLFMVFCIALFYFQFDQVYS